MERSHERFRPSASRERLLSRLSFAASGVAASSQQQQQQQPLSRASAAASGPTTPDFSTLASIGVRLGAIEDHHRCMTTEIQSMASSFRAALQQDCPRASPPPSPSQLLAAFPSSSSSPRQRLALSTSSSSSASLLSSRTAREGDTVNAVLNLRTAPIPSSSLRHPILPTTPLPTHFQPLAPSPSPPPHTTNNPSSTLRPPSALLPTTTQAGNSTPVPPPRDSHRLGDRSPPLHTDPLPPCDCACCRRKRQQQQQQQQQQREDDDVPGFILNPSPPPTLPCDGPSPAQGSGPSIIDSDSGGLAVSWGSLSLSLSALAGSGDDEEKDKDSQQAMIKSFMCPITADVMRDPVLLRETGQTYERSAIVTWLLEHMSCPLTNKRLQSRDIITNFTLRSAIEEYCGDKGIVLPPLKKDPFFCVRVWRYDESGKPVCEEIGHTQDMRQADLAFRHNLAPGVMRAELVDIRSGVPNSIDPADSMIVVQTATVSEKGCWRINISNTAGSRIGGRSSSDTLSPYAGSADNVESGLRSDEIHSRIGSWATRIFSNAASSEDQSIEVEFDALERHAQVYGPPLDARGREIVPGSILKGLRTGETIVANDFWYPAGRREWLVAQCWQGWFVPCSETMIESSPAQATVSQFRP